MNCPCKGCTKRWVSETSRCHSSCNEYKEWFRINRQQKRAYAKNKDGFIAAGNVLFAHYKKK